VNTLKRPKARCLRHYLRGIPSQTARRNIRRLYVQRISAAGLGIGGMNRAKREILERCIFQVVDDFESQAGGRPRHPVTVACHDVRNRLYDDLGVND